MKGPDRSHVKDGKSVMTDSVATKLQIDTSQKLCTVLEKIVCLPVQ